MIEGRQVLIVDDEAIIAAYAEDIFTDLGASTVSTAANVSEALSLIGAQPFDLALLDVNLSGASSEPIARALAAKGVPFVVATGYGGINWGDLSFPLINKPYTSVDLEAAFSKVCGT